MKEQKLTPLQALEMLKTMHIKAEIIKPIEAAIGENKNSISDREVEAYYNLGKSTSDMFHNCKIIKSVDTIGEVDKMLEIINRPHFNLSWFKSVGCSLDYKIYITIPKFDCDIHSEEEYDLLKDFFSHKEHKTTYIKTKYGIFNKSLVKIGNSCGICPTVSDECQDCKELILKEADSIEELCDGFVAIDESLFGRREKRYATLQEVQTDRSFLYDVCYGVIFTDKGSNIYVAKVNDKGELELL